IEARHEISFVRQPGGSVIRFLLSTTTELTIRVELSHLTSTSPDSGRSWSAYWKSRKDRTGFPATDMIISDSLMPARAAGDPGATWRTQSPRSLSAVSPM